MITYFPTKVDSRKGPNPGEKQNLGKQIRNFCIFPALGQIYLR